MNIQTVEDANQGKGECIAEIQAAANKLPVPLIDDADKITRVKMKINNLIWEEMAGDTTIRQAEGIACKTLSMMLGDTVYPSPHKS